MKLVLFVGLTGYAAAFVLERGACTADNCLRALTGTGSNDKATRPVIAKADCSSFLSTLVYATVTPSSVTTTTVVTTTVSSTSTTIQTAAATAEDVITVTTPSSTSTTSLPYTTTYTTVTYTPGFLQTIVKPVKRTVTESPAIPTYASACSGAVRYSSACSCFGVFPTTSTSTVLVTPTVTATSTTTLTVSFAETDTTTQTTTDTTTTTLTAGVATATAGGINFCGVVGRCQINNIGFLDGIFSTTDCKTYALSQGGLSYSTNSNLGCFVYAPRIEDPACEFNPNNGGLSYDIDC